jgi:FSR family fosmidomycin resistance protein-like MFS transporter
LWRVGLPGLVATVLLIPTAPLRVYASATERGSARRALMAKWRPLSLMYVFVVVRGTVQLIFVGFLSLHLIDAGMGVGEAGTALSVCLGLGSRGSLAGGFLGDRFGERAIIRLSMAAALPLFLGAFALPSMVPRVAFLSVAFFALLLSNPLTVVLAQSWVPTHRGAVSSLLMGFAWGIGGVLAPLFGRVADVYGLGPSLAVVGTLPLAGAVLAWALPPRSA